MIKPKELMMLIKNIKRLYKSIISKKKLKRKNKHKQNKLPQKIIRFNVQFLIKDNHSTSPKLNHNKNKKVKLIKQSKLKKPKQKNIQSK